MEVVHTIADLQSRIKAYRRRNDQAVGFVPTMGFLHEGHASLMNKARSQCGLVVLSIFVNPLQFGPGEDFERYPRDAERDLAVAEAAGVDLVFMPSVSEMYPSPTRTTVSVSDVTTRLCGASRPGHFDGVATVVSKLFHIVQPDQAFFGLKDAQQVAVIEQMVQDLNMPIEIVPCPTLREADGLAMSSRNVYLSPEERQQALVLSQSLQIAKEYIQSKSSQGFTSTELASLVRAHIETAPLAVVDYAEVLSYPTLEPFDHSHSISSLIIALAVKFGKTRLIDNLILQVRK
ncbi:pantoate--beta-alanine ligase [Paenibacillus roseipurpureus]|uniref:Pantothenate synthetase n=1 Tax=Paenibacillus roseopurpureus TaxID=2918901 RepID=A0AA96LVV1_9BACL|nr:pantoate--beta-alanine ligase [Paenibacillus sp. MBLB1832]WNR47068.1 pantoate--beta-alanine ligase [Paenibacillus sp. MBLB1832]